MAYVLRAIVASRIIAEDIVRQLPEARVVHLPQDFCLVPVTSSVLRALGDEQPVFPVGDDGEWSEYTAGIDSLVGTLSAQCAVAYVGAEFHGGMGTQWSIVYERRETVQPPPVGIGAVNSALKLLGVKRTTSDEFDALELGRHRAVEGWLADANSA